MEKKKLTYVWKLSIVGMALIMVSFLIVGFGYSQLEPFFAIFPYAFIITKFIWDGTWLMILLIFLQYPVYGYLLDKNRNQLKRTGLIIAILHVVFAIIAFQNMNAGFK